MEPRDLQGPLVAGRELMPLVWQRDPLPAVQGAGIRRGMLLWHILPVQRCCPRDKCVCTHSDVQTVRTLQHSPAINNPWMHARATETWPLCCSLAAAALGIACVAELGNVSIALLKLASDLEGPASSISSAEAAQLRQDGTFTVVSCALSVAAVALETIGFHRTIRVMKAVCVAVRRRAKGAGGIAPLAAEAAASTRTSACSVCRDTCAETNQ